MYLNNPALLCNNPINSLLSQNQLYNGTIPEQHAPSDRFEMMLLKECEKNSRKCINQAPTQIGYNNYNFMRASSTLAIVTKSGFEPTRLCRMDNDPAETKTEEAAAEVKTEPMSAMSLPSGSPEARPAEEAASSSPAAEHQNLVNGMEDLESELRKVDEEENSIKAVNERL